MNRISKIKTIIFLFLIVCAEWQGTALAYNIQNPYDSITPGKTQNFGMYRKYLSGIEEFHNGIDFDGSFGETIHPNICAVASGSVVYAKWGRYGNKNIFNASLEASSMIRSYGKTVIIDHGGWFSKYSHLYRIVVSEESTVTAGQKIGEEGGSGKEKLDIFPDHLHFDVFEGMTLDSILNGTNIETSKLRNPIKEGLKINSGSITIESLFIVRPGKNSSDEYRFGTDTDKKINKNSKDAYEMAWVYGMPLRLIVEAYEKASNKRTNPYQIQFKVYKKGYSSNELVFNESITFDNLNFPDANFNGVIDVGDVYSFIPEAFTKSSFYSYYFKTGERKEERFYFYKKWQPEEPGDYKVVINVYKAFTDSSGNFVVALPADGSGTKEYDLKLNMMGSFIPLEGVYASSVGESAFQVRIMNVSNACFSPDPDVEYASNKVNITFNANREADWKVEILSGGSVVRTLSAPSGSISEVSWDGKNDSGNMVSSGQYTCRVTGTISGESSKDEVVLTVDNDKPMLSSVPPQQTIRSTTEAANISFSPNESSSVVVLAIDPLSGNRIYEGPIASIDLDKNENILVDWPGAASLPNGTYNIQIAMTDKAGKYDEYNIPVYVDIQGNTASPIETIPPPERKTEKLPDMPPYNERPIVSDLAFDSSGNQYVLYGRYNKLVKYDFGGNVIATVTGVGTSEFRCPLGLAVSSSGDRVYIADTYSNRMLIYDGNLGFLREVKNGDIYLINCDVDAYEWHFGMKGNGIWRDCGGGVSYLRDENFNLPKDMYLLNNVLYVVDNATHRVLKYDKEGNAVIFDRLVADLKDEYRSNWPEMDNSWVWGKTIDRYLVYSNALNDTVGYNNRIQYVLKEYDGAGKSYIPHVAGDLRSSSNNSGFFSPEAVAVDSSGNLYITDTGNNRIQKFAPDGSFVATFGSAGSGPGQFNSPQGICLDEDGHIWIADTGNKRIQEFNNDETFVKAWGNSKILSKPLKLVVKKIGSGKVVYAADGDSNSVKIFGVSPPKDFKIIADKEEFLAPSKTFSLSWEASEDNWYGLKEYQVLIKRQGSSSKGQEESWGALKSKISPDDTSTSIDLPFDEIWEIKVRAYNNHNLWTDSQVIRVKMDSTPPLPFWISYPYKDGQKFDSKDVPITWDEARDDNLDYYELVVGTDPDNIHGSSIYSNTFSATATREIWLKNLARGKYYMYMIAYDKAGHSRRLDGKTDIPQHDADFTYAWKEEWPMFEMATAPPSSFSLAWPYNGQYFDTQGEIEIAWNESLETNLDRYELAVGTDPADPLASAVYFATFEASVSRKSKVKFERGVYYISVTAFDKDGNWRNLKGECNVPELSDPILSSWPSFEVGTIPPEIFTLAQPYDGQFIDGKTVKIAWNEAPDKNLSHYELIIGTKEADIHGSAVYSNKFDVSVSRECEVTLPLGIYYIYLAAYDDDGNYRTIKGKTNVDRFSKELLTFWPSFEAGTSPPGIFILSHPYNGQFFDSRKVCVGWNRADDPDINRYELIIGTDETRVVGSKVFSATYEAKAASAEVELPGGQYFIKLVAYDNDDNWRDLKGKTNVAKYDNKILSAWPSFEVDNTPPTISKGEATRTTIKCLISDQSSSVETKCEIIGGNKVIKSWTNKAPPGWFTFTWDDVKVPDDIYKIKITATDQVGNTSTDESLSIVVDTTPPQIKNIMNSGVFSPNGDRKFDVDTISCEVTDNLSEKITTTIEVVETTHPLNPPLFLREGETERSEEGVSLVTWIWDGVGVEDGLCHYLITATDQSGNSSTGTAQVIVDTTPPAITAIATNPKTELDLNNSGGKLDFSFQVSEPANVGLTIYDSNYSLLHDTIVTAEAGGAKQISWDGRDTFGSFVPNNTYINYAISATDCVANSATYNPVNIVKVLSPVTGLAGNILYSPDGAVKIIIPAGAAPEGTDLAIAEDEAAAKTIKLVNKDNVTKIYRFGKRGESGEVKHLSFKKSPILVMRFDNSVLNSKDQPVELWRSGSDWLKVAGDSSGEVFSAFLETTAEFALFADLTPPAAPKINQLESPTRNARVAVTGTAESGTKIVLTLDALTPRSLETFASSSGKFTAELVLSEGINRIRARAVDNAGNTSPPSETTNVELDTTPPVITLNSPPTIYLSAVNNKAEIDCSATDAATIIIVVKDTTGKILSTVNDSKLGVDTSLFTSDGHYPYLIKAFDLAGNVGRKDGKIVVDKTKPQVLLEADKTSYIVSDDLTLSGLADDNNLQKYTLEYGKGESPASWTEITRGFAPVTYQQLYQLNTRILEDGVYAFRLTAQDWGGNTNIATIKKQVVNTDLQTYISSPTSRQVVAGSVEVMGSIVGDNFLEYKIEYGAGAAPSFWHYVASAKIFPAGKTLGWLNTLSIQDGSYTLKLSVTNVANHTASYTLPITIDNTKPSLAINFPNDKDYLGGIIDIAGIADDVNFKNYQVEYSDGQTWTKLKTSTTSVPNGLLASWNTSGLNGAYTIRLTAEDQAGNTNQITRNITVDNVVSSGSVAITSPPAGEVIRKSVSIVGRAGDENFKEYKLEYSETNKSAWTTIGLKHVRQVTSGSLETWDTTGVSDGTYKLRLTVIDLASNLNTSEVAVIVDNTKPSLAINFPNDKDYLGGVINIDGIANDVNFKNYQVEYSDGQTWTKLKTSTTSVPNGLLASWNTSGLNGSYTIRLTAEDQAGNTHQITRNITVDNGVSSGSVAITSPPAGEVIRKSVPMLGRASDENFKEYKLEYSETNKSAWTTIGLKHSGQVTSGSLETWDTTGVSDRPYRLRLTVTDLASNLNTSEVTVIVDNTNPLLAINFPNDNDYLGGIINIDGIADDVNFKTYRVEYSDGQAWAKLKNSTTPMASGLLASWNTSGLNGVYTIRLTVEDQAGNTSQATKNITVDNEVPISVITAPLAGEVIRRSVPMLGRASDENFKEYKLEYCEANKSDWTTIGLKHLSQITSGSLETWNTTGVSDGIYKLRLTVTDLASNCNTDEVLVVVDNSQPTINITYPQVGNVLGGKIKIAGTITDANFQEYLVEYGEGNNPLSWSVIQGPTFNIPSGDLAVWNTGSFNGLYTIRLTVTDKAGNISSTQETITVDNTNPEINITSPVKTDIMGGSISVKGTVTDLHLTNYRLEYGFGQDPQAWTGIKTSASPVSGGELGRWETSSLKNDGVYSLRLTASDEAGNVSVCYSSVTIDNTNPTAAITYPTPSLVVANTIPIQGTAIDEAHFKEYKVEYGNTQIGTTHNNIVLAGTLETWDTTTVADGTYTLRLTVKDVVDNTMISEIPTIVDNTYPTVSLSFPAAGSCLAGGVKIEGTIFDANLDHYILEYRNSASPEGWNIIDWNWVDAAGLNGNYVIRIRGYDKTGKTSSAEVAVILDNTPPLINVVSPSRESVNSGSVDITGEISDINLSEYSLKYGYGIEPTAWSTLSSGSASKTGTLYSWNTQNVKDGYYTLKFEAKDKAGNYSTKSFVITVDNSPPVAAIHEPVAGAYVKGIVPVKGVACDADFTTYNFRHYEINVGSGLVPDRWTTIESLVVPKINDTLTNWNTTGASDGTYTLKLKSYDISNTIEATRIVVVDNTLPTVAITSPTQGQTVSGSVSITGTATDANFSEYKVYYKSASSADWTIIGGGSSPIPPSSSLVTWNSVLLGDGQYSLKLWVKDKAGNENEITRNVTVNNVLAVVNDSVSPSAISPNGDGVDDEAKINYTLSENSPVTIKIYKKPASNTYNWRAFAEGVRYPAQDFNYVLNATGIDHPPQSFSYTLNAAGTNHLPQPFTYSLSASGTSHPPVPFTYTLSASGTKYPPQDFYWKVDASGVETWYVATSIDTGVVYGSGSSLSFTANFDHECSYAISAMAFPVDNRGAWASIKNETANSIIDSVGRSFPPGTSSKNGVFSAESGKHYSANAGSNGYGLGIASAKINYQIKNDIIVSASDPSAGSKTATIDHRGTITGNSYSVTLSPINGGTISGHTISFSQTSNASGATATRDGSGWGGNTCSGIINATYKYPGDAWSKPSDTLSASCESLAGGNYTSDWLVKSKLQPDAYVEGVTWKLSAPSDSNVSLKFTDGTTSTSNGDQKVTASTSYTGVWNLNPPADGSGSCNSGPGSPTNHDVAISSLIPLNSLPDKTDNFSFKLSNPSDPDVFLRFSGTGTQTTSNHGDRIIGSTSYTEPWSPSPILDSDMVTSGPGSPKNYSRSISSIISVPAAVSNPQFQLSKLSNGNVSLRFSNGSTITSNPYDTILASTTYIQPWGSSIGGSGFCKSGPGSPTNYISSKIRNMVSLPSTTDNLQFSLSSSSNNNVSFRFSNGSNITSNPDDYIIGTTFFTEPWNSAMDQQVGGSGWLTGNQNPIPFNYDEAPDFRSVRETGYTPPADVVVNSWRVESSNPDVIVYDAGNPNGDFKVKISDNLLVKTVQSNASTTPGNQSVSWDGKDNQGNVLPDGDYIYYIYAGPNIVKKTGSIKIARSSEFTTASLSESYISPNSDGLKDSTAINYTLTEPATVNISVLDKNGATIETFTASGNKGVNTSTWGGVTSDGTYTVRITATNANGTQRSKDLSLVVDNNSLTAPIEPARKLVSAVEDPAYAPDKNQIAFAKIVSGNKQIFTYQLASSNVEMLTTNGNNFQPTWSPDGSKLTFTSDRTGNNDIWLMNANGNNQKQITTDNASEVSPTFSPDGQKVAYASNRTGKLVINKWNIWQVGINGKNPTQITTDDNTNKDDQPTWSPDGKKIAYASDQSGSFNLWTINSDGTMKTQLTSSIEAGTLPAWSPDGLKIAYAKESGIAIRQISNGGEVWVTQEAGASNPAWSRDGTELLYNTATGDIYAKKVYTGALTGIITTPIPNQVLSGLVEIRGTALDTNFDSYKLEATPNNTPYQWQTIASGTKPINNGILGTWNTATGNDGEYLLRLTVSDLAGNSQQESIVVKVENNNWKLTISKLTQLTSGDAWDVQPAWSPDGTKLAFSSNRTGNYDIWVMLAEGTSLKNLTNDPSYDDKPAWSPDGTKLAFVSDRSGNKDVWLINADGTGMPQQLTNLICVDTDPTWSPDGTKLAFSSNRSGNYDIWLTNADGSGSPTKLTSSEADDKEPNWSRFGIAFTSERSGNKDVWLIADVNNPDLIKLTTSEAEDSEPCWSPAAIPLSDGSHRPLITFTSTRSGNQDIFVMDTDGIDQSKSLTDYTNVDCNPAWSPDGTKVAYASYKDGKYNLWSMTFGINAIALSVRSQAASQKPQLKKPTDGSTLNTLRPIFEWVGVENVTDYRIELGKTASWVVPTRKIAKTITQSAASTPEPYVTARIDEFDDALTPDTWYWKVFAISGTQETASDGLSWSFTTAPDFSLSGITNYPNPFNPNKEKTKIRYRLSTDASEVKIRIYDITGSLVNELDGTTNGEGSSIWDKYNDVEWDGRNGRGDVVMNGIYPYEISAKSGDRILTGRGKIAVLK